MAGLSIGIVGLANVGKSTLFNALLKQKLALAANYPFATIEPNNGMATVPDGRLEVLARIVKTEVIKKATVEFIDIAGLVAGAAQGAGLGNKFLAHIRETDLICHVLRDFADEDILREGSTDAKSDLEVIRMELLMADLATLEKQVAPKGAASAEAKKRWEAIEEMRGMVEKGEMINLIQDEDIKKVAQELNLLTAKEEMVALNVGEDELREKMEKRGELARELGVAEKGLVVVSAKIESELSELTEEEQKEMLAEMGVGESGLERLARVAYETLELQSFLTAGELEARAWTIKKGATAVEAAGEIHTDFAQKFIKAQVVSFEDFVEYGGWRGVKESGKMRQEGRDYVMQDGEVVEFMVGK